MGNIIIAVKPPRKKNSNKKKYPFINGLEMDWNDKQQVSNYKKNYYDRDTYYLNKFGVVISEFILSIQDY